MKKKSKERLAFNFLKSYYEVFKKLPDSESKSKFIEAICERQFNGKETTLEGMADFAYTSQKHSIDASREGWETVQNRTKTVTPSTPPSEGASKTPSEEEKEEEEVKEKEELTTTYLSGGHLSITLGDFNKLAEAYGTEKAQEYCHSVLNWTKNHKVKSLYYTSLKWLKKDNVTRIDEAAPELTELEKLEAHKAKARKEAGWD